MNKIDSIQAFQEDEYWFPYHHVSKMPSAGFSQHFIDTWGINYISTIEFVLSKIEENSFSSIIDIGCGDGRMTYEIHKKFPSIKVLGVDYSSRAINLAKAMIEKTPNLDYLQIDLCSSALSRNFDSAVLMEVLEHIPLIEVDKFVTGVHRAIRPGGILLLTVPHVNKPIEYKHFQHFSADSISKHLSPLFDVVEIIPFEKKAQFLRKVVRMVLCNNLFVLNNKTVLGLLYAFYQKYLFHCTTERQCQRLFVKAIAK